MADVKAMMVGVVIRVAAGVGATVQADDPIVVLESMKMELPLVAPSNGVVRELRVQIGDVVQEGDVVAVIE